MYLSCCMLWFRVSTCQLSTFDRFQLYGFLYGVWKDVEGKMVLLLNLQR